MLAVTVNSSARGWSASPYERGWVLCDADDEPTRPQFFLEGRKEKKKVDDLRPVGPCEFGKSESRVTDRDRARWKLNDPERCRGPSREKGKKKDTLAMAKGPAHSQLFACTYGELVMKIQSQACIVVSQRSNLSTIQISSPDRRMGDAGMQPAFLGNDDTACQELPGCVLSMA